MHDDLALTREELAWLRRRAKFGRSRIFRRRHSSQLWARFGKSHRGLFSFHGRFASAIGYRW